MDNSEDFIERDEVIADSEEEMEGLGSSSAAERGEVCRNLVVSCY